MNNYRPQALLIQGTNDENKEVIENSVYSQEFTIGFHIIIGIALACLAWCLMIKPIFSSSSENWILAIFSMIIWIVILPIVILATGVLTDSIMSKSSIIFIYIKYVTIWITAMATIFFIYKMKDWSKFKKFSIVLLAFVNIMEAALDQLQILPTEDESKRIEDKKDPSNMINGIIGIIIALLFVWAGYKSNFDVTNVHGMNILNYELCYMLIFAYTLWNLHFRSYLLQNTSTFFFFVVSLVLPIISNWYYPGSWFQVRVLTLFFYISIILGLSKDQSRLLPLYNEQGYIQKPDSENWLSYVQKNDAYKYSLIAFTILFIILSMLIMSNFDWVNKIISKFK
jgi:hypothetical protein